MIVGDDDDSTFVGPYRGLEPFDEGAAAFFFGRERETLLIKASLFASPLTLLYGASGVGKSSVLRAGVIPALRERPDVLPVVFPRFSRGAVEQGWQGDPVSGIKETVRLTLLESAANDPEKRRLYGDLLARNLELPLGKFLESCSDASERLLMVILDQFEEYSLYHPEDELFAEQFPKAIQPSNSAYSFLVSLREDALARLDRFKGRIPTLWDSYRRIDHLDRKAAEDAIRLPLRKYNERRPDGEPAVTIEDSLVDAVLEAVQTDAVEFDSSGVGSLSKDAANKVQIETPYLQLVLTRLWEREREEHSPVLRLATLQDEKGAEEIVRTHLDRVMANFTRQEQDIAARVFHRLVTPSGTKIAFSAADLAEYEKIEVEQLTPILSRLEEGSRRILRRVAVRSDAADEPRYEIFHDRLGKAVLAWRTKHLKEQAHEIGQIQEAERMRIEESGRSKLRDQITGAIGRLSEEETAVWAQILPCLVSGKGVRVAQTRASLASLTRQPEEVIQRVLQQLLEGGIVRISFSHAKESVRQRPPKFEIVHDPLAVALQEWHSDYVRRQTPDAPAFTGAEAIRPAEERSQEIRPPFELLGNLFQKGDIIPFIGAGVSASAREGGSTHSGLPAGDDLRESLARESGFPQALFDATDMAGIASFYVQKAGRERLTQFLRSHISDRGNRPSATHRFLAERALEVPCTILTTNYDTLMEDALREAGVRHIVYELLVDKPGSDVHIVRPVEELTMVMRLYGSGDHYVITEEDHIDWIRKFANSEYAAEIYSHGRSSKMLLSLGHSARDWSQRAILRTFLEERSSRSSTGWAIALNPSPVSIATWQRYRMEVFNLELDEWVAQMRQAMGPAAGSRNRM